MGQTAFIDDDKHSKESTGKMRGTRNDFDDDDDDVNDENDALFFTDGEASRWWWRLCFSTSTMRPLTYSRGDGIVSGDKKLAYARARK